MFTSRTDWNLTPNRLAAALEERRSAGKDILDLTESNPTRCEFQYAQAAVLQALSQPAVLRYEPDARGLRVAREAVAGYYRDRSVAQPVAASTAPSAEDIVLTASTSEAYSFLFRLLCEAGDEVLAPAPSYPLLEYLASLQDVRLARYPLLYHQGGDHGWQMDLPGLEAALTPRTRAVVVVHPNNPTGSFVKPAEAESLAWLCANHGLALIADEVFLDFTQDGLPRASFCERRDVLTFALSGLSKLCGLPQMKLGWIAIGGPAELATEAQSRLEVIADTYLSVNTPAQLALPELLALGAGFQLQVNARVAGNLAELDRQLAGHPQCRRLQAEGGWYVVLRIPAARSDEEFCLDLLRDYGVLVHPGHFFDFPGEGHLILSLIPPPQTFAAGVSRLLKVAAGAQGIHQ